MHALRLPAVTVHGRHPAVGQRNRHAHLAHQVRGPRLGPRAPLVGRLQAVVGQVLDGPVAMRPYHVVDAAVGQHGGRVVPPVHLAGRVVRHDSELAPRAPLVGGEQRDRLLVRGAVVADGLPRLHRVHPAVRGKLEQHARTVGGVPGGVEVYGDELRRRPRPARVIGPVDEVLWPLEALGLSVEGLGYPVSLKAGHPHQQASVGDHADGRPAVGPAVLGGRRPPELTFVRPGRQAIDGSQYLGPGVGRDERRADELAGYVGAVRERGDRRHVGAAVRGLGYDTSVDDIHLRTQSRTELYGRGVTLTSAALRPASRASSSSCSALHSCVGPARTV